MHIVCAYCWAVLTRYKLSARIWRFIGCVDPPLSFPLPSPPQLLPHSIWTLRLIFSDLVTVKQQILQLKILSDSFRLVYTDLDSCKIHMQARFLLASFPGPRPASHRLQYGKAVLQATGSYRIASNGKNWEQG